MPKRAGTGSVRLYQKTLPVIGNKPMIGDRMHDVEGAQLCGLDSLGIYTGFAPEGELEDAGATYVFHTIRDMADFLLNN